MFDCRPEDNPRLRCSRSTSQFTQVPEQTASMPDELHTPSSVEQCVPAPQLPDPWQTASAAFSAQPLKTKSRVHLVPSGEHELGPNVG